VLCCGDEAHLFQLQELQWWLLQQHWQLPGLLCRQFQRLCQLPARVCPLPQLYCQLVLQHWQLPGGHFELCCEDEEQLYRLFQQCCQLLWTYCGTCCEVGQQWDWVQGCLQWQGKGQQGLLEQQRWGR